MQSESGRFQSESAAATGQPVSALRFWIPVMLAVLALLASTFSTQLKASEHSGESFRGYTAPFVFKKPSTPAPDAAFVDIYGNPQTLADYQGKVVLVNLWATWCSTCILEMPELNALQKKLGDKNFKVLTLNQDLKSGQQALAFLHQRGFHNLTGHLDPNFQFGQAFDQKLLPMSILFDSQGRQIGHLIGAADWSSEQAQALIKRFLPKTDAAANQLQSANSSAFVLKPLRINTEGKYFFNRYL